MILFLKIGVMAAFLFSVIALAFLVARTLSFGRRRLYAEAVGSVKKGVFYAFGRGMMPWEKESAGKHLFTYAAGVLYHLAVFSALLYLFLVVFSLHLPPLFLVPLRVLLFIGFTSGAALLLKRLFSPLLRAVSCPDDFFANIVVDLLVVLALAHTFRPALTPPFLLAGMAVFLYIPVGKLRHCAFFFYTRVLFGLFFGRRDILPPSSSEAAK